MRDFGLNADCQRGSAFRAVEIQLESLDISGQHPRSPGLGRQLGPAAAFLVGRLLHQFGGRISQPLRPRPAGTAGVTGPELMGFAGKWHRSCGQSGCGLGGFNAGLGDGEIFRVDFAADEIETELDGRNSDRSAAHVRVEDRRAGFQP